MRILCLADEFGYGPVALLQRAIEHLPTGTSVLAHLSDSQAKLIRAPTGVTLTIDQGPGPDCDLAGVEAAILAGGYHHAEHLLEQLPHVVIIDQLFWYWSSLPRAVHMGAHVLAQDFFGVRARANAHGNVHVVGPIVPDVRADFDHLRVGLLINLGGFKSPFHEASHATAYVEMLAPLVESARSFDKRLFLTGGPMVVAAFREAYPDLAQAAATVGHTEMLRLIGCSELYCTVPGLGSIYEPLLLGTPTLFLPPTNLTQALQARALSHHLSYPWLSASLSDLIPECANERDEEEFIPNLFSRYSLHPPLDLPDAAHLIHGFVKSSGELSSDEQSRIDRFLSEMGGFGDEGFGQRLREGLNG